MIGSDYSPTLVTLNQKFLSHFLLRSFSNPIKSSFVQIKSRCSLNWILLLLVIVIGFKFVRRLDESQRTNSSSKKCNSEFFNFFVVWFYCCKRLHNHLENLITLSSRVPDECNVRCQMSRRLNNKLLPVVRRPSVDKACLMFKVFTWKPSMKLLDGDCAYVTCVDFLCLPLVSDLSLKTFTCNV